MYAYKKCFLIFTFVLFQLTVGTQRYTFILFIIIYLLWMFVFFFFCVYMRVCESCCMYWNSHLSIYFFHCNFFFFFLFLTIISVQVILNINHSNAVLVIYYLSVLCSAIFKFRCFPYNTIYVNCSNSSCLYWSFSRNIDFPEKFWLTLIPPF